MRSGADYLVVGVDSAAQVREVSEALKGDALADAFADAVGELPGVPEAVRDPRKWSAT
jgi:hypothetical protein